MTPLRTAFVATVLVSFLTLVSAAGNQAGLLERIRETHRARLTAHTKLVTPCDLYNGMHALGTGNCLECTHLYFSDDALDVANNPSDYIMVRGRDGDFYPMKRPVAIELKKLDNMEACRWCPSSQTCGHPLDSTNKCPDFFGNSTGGWVDRSHCVDTDITSREKYDEMERKVNAKLAEMNEEERTEFENQEAKATKYPTDNDVLETQELSKEEGVYDCYGKCVLSGVTACSTGTLKVMPRTADEVIAQRKNEVLSSDTKRETTGQPVPCRFNVPDDGMTARRAHGRFSPGQRDWIECELIPCVQATVNNPGS